MRYGQLVMGPAGCGKSTYCATMQKHGAASRRTIHVVNLDPAAENFDYNPIADIRDLIHLDDVTQDAGLKLGPNGGLVYCVEYLVQNLEWLEEAIGEVEDDYILFDCPGQIELFTHVPVMPKLAKAMEAWNFRMCGVFILDTQFMLDPSKFFSGCLVALSAMVNVEMPHVNVLSKMDLLTNKNKQLVENFLEPDYHLMMEEGDGSTWNKRYRKLTRAIAQVLDSYSLVRFLPLNISDENSISDVLLSVDSCIQWGEDQETRDRYPEEMDPDEDDGRGPDNGKYE